MNNFAFLDLGMPDLLLVITGIVMIVAIALITRAVYKGFVRGYLAKE